MRGNPGANVSTETGRARVSSCAFHIVQPLPAATWSTSRYRPASRVPGSEVYVLIRKRQEWGRSRPPSSPGYSRSPSGSHAVPLNVNVRRLPGPAPGYLPRSSVLTVLRRILPMSHTRIRSVPQEFSHVSRMFHYQLPARHPSRTETVTTLPLVCYVARPNRPPTERSTVRNSSRPRTRAQSA